MAVAEIQNPIVGETTCGSLLQQLQQIWDEVGESDEERDKMLLQLEQECLDVYKRKVDLAAKSRAHLLQALADAKVELSTLLSALGEKTFVGIPEKTTGTIKEQLEAISPALEQLWKQKEERIKEFSDVQSQIQKICGEIAGSSEQVGSPAVDQSDLSLKKLDEFHAQLLELQKEKSDRLHKVLEFVSTVHDLCAVLGMDFFTTVTEVHPSLNDSTGVQSKSISNDTLSRLAKTVLALKEDKKQRLQKMTSNDGCDDSVHWAPRVDAIFIRILHKHVKKGELQTSTFDKKVWRIIDNELFATVGKKYTPVKLKAKFNRLRLRHREFSALLDQTGFGWDPQSNTVEASEDTWANYIKSHPNAKVFKKKGCEHYSILGEIFNTTIATNQLHHASTQEPPLSDEERDLEEVFLSSGVHVDIGSGAGDVGNAGTRTVNNERRAKRDSKATKFEIALDAWASHLSVKSVLSKAKAEHLLTKQDDACSSFSEPYSIDECMEMLDSIDGVSDENYFRACENFTDPNWRHMFIKMPTHRKKAWVNGLTSV